MNYYRCNVLDQSLLSLPTWKTISGDIATFDTSYTNPLRSCVAQIVAQQAGSGDASPSNVRAISGWSGVSVSVVGKNMADQTQFVRGSISGTGNDTVSTTRLRSPFIKVNPNGVYVFSTNSALFIYEIHEYDKNQHWLQYTGISNTSGSVTLLSTTGYIKILIRKSDNADIVVSELTSFQMENGSTATAYEAYNGSKYQSYFEGLMNGTYTFVDLGSLTWTRSTSYTNPFFYCSIASSPSTTNNNGICETYGKYSSSSPIDGEYFGNNAPDHTFTIGTVNGLQIFIRDDSYTDAATFTTAMNGVYLIYELATSITPTITQVQIDTLIQAFNDNLVCVVLGQTVYGGSGDVCKANGISKTWGKTTFGEMNWSYSNDGYFYSSISDKKIGITNVICDSYATSDSPSVSGMSNNQIKGRADTKYIYLKDSRYTTGSDLVTNMGSAVVIYELDTSETLTTPALSIPTLSGTNNIYVDTGNISVTAEMTLQEYINQQ